MRRRKIIGVISMRRVAIIGVIVFMLISCATANERTGKDVSFKLGLLQEISGEFVIVNETAVIRKSDVVGGDLGFGVLLSSDYDFEFVAEVTFPKTSFRGKHVSTIRFGEDGVSVKMKRRTKNGYGYVSLKLDNSDPLGGYVIKIYAGDVLVFRALFEVVES